MTDPLHGLDDVDWAGLHHAYGPATDIPDLLRALLSPSAEERAAALYEGLGSRIWHQGTRYRASIAAVPFLVSLAAHPDTPGRAELVQDLADLAVGYPHEVLPYGVDIAARRADLEERRGLSPEGWQRRLDAWVAAAPDEFQRGRRERLREKRDQAAELARLETELAVYDAVLTRVPALLPLLDSPDGALRGATAALLALFPERAAATAPALAARLAAHPETGAEPESDPTALSNVITALGLLRHRPAVPPIRDHLHSDHPTHRLAAATALLVLEEGAVHGMVIGHITAFPFLAGAGSHRDPYRTLVTSGSPDATPRFLLRARADPAALPRILHHLRTGPAFDRRPMAAAALTLAFGILDRAEGTVHTSAPILPDHPGTGPGTAASRRRTTIRALADLPSEHWDDPVITSMLGAYGLPTDRPGLRRHLTSVPFPHSTPQDAAP